MYISACKGTHGLLWFSCTSALEKVRMVYCGSHVHQLLERYAWFIVVLMYISACKGKPLSLAPTSSRLVALGTKYLRCHLSATKKITLRKQMSCGMRRCQKADIHTRMNA